MSNGFKISWRLILINICVMIAGALLVFVPVFQNHTYLLLTVCEALIVIPVLMGMYYLKNEENVGMSVFKGFPHSIIPILMVLPFCLQCFVTYLTIPLNGFLLNLLGEQPSVVAAPANFVEFLKQVVAICLVPAVLEEFLCRGVIMRLLKPYGAVISMTISALAFTILHFSLYSLLIIFMMGMLLAAIRIMTGSLWACVLVHFSNNLTAILCLMIINNTVLIVTLNLLSAVMFPFLLIILTKKLRPNFEGLDLSKKEKAGFSWEMAVCLLLFVIFNAAAIT